MYKIPKKTITSIERNESIEGETLEMQIQRMINNGEVLGEEKEMIYTKPSEGVVYGTDIRGDKQEKAIELPYRDWETDRKSTRLNSSHRSLSRMPSSA